MGASYSKLTPGHEEAIYEMRKAGKTGRQMRQALAQGVPGEAPVSISNDRVLKVARRLLDERDELYSSDVQNRPAPEGLRLLTRRLMLIAERETRRLERAEKAGRLDANKLGRLATAVTKLHGLLERNDEAPDPGEAAKKGDSAPSQPTSSPFAAQLAAEAARETVHQDAPETAPGDAAPVADRVISEATLRRREAEASAGVDPAQAVPSDPPEQSNGQGPKAGSVRT